MFGLTLEIIKKHFENEAISRSETFEWHKKFLDGREATSDDSALVDLQLQEVLKWCQKFEKLFDQIDK